MSSPFSCFDWASSFYDYTRAIPDDLITKICSVVHQNTGSRTSFLEVGIGTGRIAVPLSEKLNANLIGIDISEKMIQKCREKISPFSNVSLIIADGLALPFSENQFSLILTSHVLHLLSDPFQFVRRIAQLLTKNGYYVNLDAYVNYHQTLPFQIYYNKLSESGYRYTSPGSHIRQEITLYLSKKGWFYHQFTINGTREISLNDLVTFIRDRVFSHQRAITEDFHKQSLKYLYQELETRNIDLTEKVLAPAKSHITLFQRP